MMQFKDAILSPNTTQHSTTNYNQFTSTIAQKIMTQELSHSKEIKVKAGFLQETFNCTCESYFSDAKYLIKKFLPPVFNILTDF